MKAKERAKCKIIEYIGNPENEFPNRTQMAKGVCGYKDPHYIYEVFSIDELEQLEREGLEIRRSKYSRYSAIIDLATIKAAIKGSAIDRRLYYEKFENWNVKASGRGDKKSTDRLQKLIDVIKAGPIKRGESVG
jgi:hypothetical protein